MTLLEKIEDLKQSTAVLKEKFKNEFYLKGISVPEDMMLKEYPELVKIIPEEGLADTSMATATPADLVQGKTAVVNGELISGDIVPLGGLTVTPDVVPVTIPAGYYTEEITVDTIPLDGDAIAADIIEGATARVGGQLITGTLPILDALNITPGLEGADYGRGLYAGVKVKPLKQATLTQSGVLTVKATAGLVEKEIFVTLSDKNHVAGNIAAGKRIFGVEGNFTADATATAADIIKDKTAYVNGEKITGTAAGGGGEYHLCTYVNRTYETGEFTVSGLPDDLFINLSDWDGNLYPEEYRTKKPNGTFAPYYTEGSLSEWKFRNEHGTVVYYNGEWMAWVFAPFAQGETDYWLSNFPVRASSSWDDPKYPWDSSLQWTLNDVAFSLDIGPVIPPPVEPYWNGYKLELNDSGKYDIDYSEEHQMAYGDFMPVAGRFYDSGCSVEISAANLEDSYLLSTPTNMTSNENDEWLITASHEYNESSGKHYAYHAFDGRTDKDWNTGGDSSSNTFIQWQCKTHKVLLKQLDIYGYDWEELPKLNEGRAYLEGSNDGSDWKQLTVTLPDGFNYSDRCASFKLTDNYEFFSYYRIRYSNGTYRWVITEIKGTYLNEREVPK